MGSFIGKSVKRVEDKRFLTGKGLYTDDIVLHGMTYATIIRSHHAHAKILSIDTGEAEKADGVVAIFTGADIAAAEIGGVPCGWQVDFKNGDTMKEPLHPLLVADKVRYMGDAVAVVIAESTAAAQDAAELVAVDYEILDAVVKGPQALDPDALLVHDDVPNNTCYDWELGDKEKTDEAMDNAQHVTTLEFINQRLIPNAIEPRCAIGHFESTTGKYTLYTTTQNPHLTRLLMSAFVLGIPEQKVRVVSPDVGGGFGSKIPHYIEEALMVWCSKEINRPVKWTAERNESFMTDTHGRDHVTKAEMGFDADGKIIGLRVKTVANLGAYLSTFSTCVPTYLHGTLLQGLYTTPAIHIDLTAVFTNTTPVDALRGAGRPEATYLLERLVDNAAREMGMDPADLRFKNFIPPFDGVSQPGYQTEVALQYDSGNYEKVLTKALEMVDYKELRNQLGSCQLPVGGSCTYGQLTFIFSYVTKIRDISNIN